MYEYAIFDPRPNGADTNDTIVVQACGLYGVEVTVPALAARCAANLDPQHDGDATTAAISAAVTWPLPPAGATLVTVRPDLDALDAMAILAIRATGETPTLMVMDGVRAIEAADTFARGEWAPRAWPTRRDPWPAFAGVEDTRELAAIGVACADHQVPLATRVEWVTNWLRDRSEPAGYRQRVEQERREMIAALEDGTIMVRTSSTFVGHTQHRIAVVRSTHRAAMLIGYAAAPVVVACNPAFQFAGGEPHIKYTVAQFAPGFVDLAQVFQRLSVREPGWGGSPTIGGSPQGMSSVLSIETVVRETILAMTTSMGAHRKLGEVLFRDDPYREPYPDFHGRLNFSEQQVRDHLLHSGFFAPVFEGGNTPYNGVYSVMDGARMPDVHSYDVARIIRHITEQSPANREAVSTTVVQLRTGGYAVLRVLDDPTMGFTFEPGGFDLPHADGVDPYTCGQCVPGGPANDVYDHTHIFWRWAPDLGTLVELGLTSREREVLNMNVELD